mgnify:CR=1 FL=1
MLDRNPTKRVRAAEALRHPWLSDADSTSALPLRSSVVQRLQRFATYGHLKQLVRAGRGTLWLKHACRGAAPAALCHLKQLVEAGAHALLHQA